MVKQRQACEPMPSYTSAPVSSWTLDKSASPTRKQSSFHGIRTYSAAGFLSLSGATQGQRCITHVRFQLLHTDASLPCLQLTYAVPYLRNLLILKLSRYGSSHASFFYASRNARSRGLSNGGYIWIGRNNGPDDLTISENSESSPSI